MELAQCRQRNFFERYALSARPHALTISLHRENESRVLVSRYEAFMPGRLAEGRSTLFAYGQGSFLHQLNRARKKQTGRDFFPHSQSSVLTLHLRKKRVASRSPVPRTPMTIPNQARPMPCFSGCFLILLMARMPVKSANGAGIRKNEKRAR